MEENNTITFNLAAYIHVLLRPAEGFGQPGEFFLESPDLLNPADTSAAGFYITNAYNTFVGNAASGERRVRFLLRMVLLGLNMCGWSTGGWTGFAFPNLPRPILLHKDHVMPSG